MNKEEKIREMLEELEQRLKAKEELVTNEDVPAEEEEEADDEEEDVQDEDDDEDKDLEEEKCDKDERVFYGENEEGLLYMDEKDLQEIDEGDIEVKVLYEIASQLNEMRKVMIYKYEDAKKKKECDSFDEEEE